MFSLTKYLSILICDSLRLEGMSSQINTSIPPPFPFMSSLYSSEKPCKWNCPLEQEESSFSFEIISILILSLIILASRSNLFLWELMFKWAQINLLGFFNLRLLICSSGIERSLFERFNSRVSLAWLSFSEFKCTDVGKSIFCCWCQSNFVKNDKKFSAKTLTPLKFKCNLISFRCLLESILSICEMNGIFLSAHINTKRLLTSVALLLRLSKRVTMPDTITKLP